MYSMINADYLFLCTDVECLYTDNPRTNPNATPVRIVEDIKALKDRGINMNYKKKSKRILKLGNLVSVSSPGSSLGTGGMVTKLIAADLATAAGCSTIITLGSDPDRILTIIQQVPPMIPSKQQQQDSHSNDSSKPGEVGLEITSSTTSTSTTTKYTLFLAKPNPMVDRKWWIMHGLASYGAVYIDSGAVAALVGSGRRSLFAAGILGIEGTFAAQQCVRILAIEWDGREGQSVLLEKSSSLERDSSVSDLIQRFLETPVFDGVTLAEKLGGRVVEIGKGLVNYNFSEVLRIRGCKSSEIPDILGYMDSDCVIHRDNIALSEKR
jgi:glutamate 5-kinase